MKAKKQCAWLLLLANSVFFTACGTIAPLGDDGARPHPVERVDVAVLFQPQIEWEVKADRNLASNDGGQAALTIIGACLKTLIFAPLCLPVAVPAAIIVEGATYGVESARRAPYERATDAVVNKHARVRVIDLRELVDGLGLQAQLRAAIHVGNWRVSAAGSSPGSESVVSKLPTERVLRLEVQVDRIKALSAAPVRNLWVHEVDITWRLVDPLGGETIDLGTLTYEKVLNVSLQYDEVAGRWISKDDGRFAEDWAAASREIAGRIAERTVPSISAYGLDTPQ